MVCLLIPATTPTRRLHRSDPTRRRACMSHRTRATRGRLHDADAGVPKRSTPPGVHTRLIPRPALTRPRMMTGSLWGSPCPAHLATPRPSGGVANDPRVPVVRSCRSCSIGVVSMNKRLMPRRPPHVLARSGRCAYSDRAPMAVGCSYLIAHRASVAVERMPLGRSIPVSANTTARRITLRSTATRGFNLFAAMALNNKA